MTTPERAEQLVAGLTEAIKTIHEIVPTVIEAFVEAGRIKRRHEVLYEVLRCELNTKSPHEAARTAVEAADIVYPAPKPPESTPSV